MRTYQFKCALVESGIEMKIVQEAHVDNLLRDDKEMRNYLVSYWARITIETQVRL